MGLYSKIVDGFKKAFETKCVTLLVSAYHTSIVDHIYSPGWMENDFTSMLDEYIDKNPQRVKWKISCNVEHHLHKKGLKKKKGYANSEDRIDLRFTTFSSKDEYCFFVEAVDTTIQKINALLTKKKRESEMLNRQSHSLHDQYFESTHPNFGVISHFVFDYTA